MNLGKESNFLTTFEVRGIFEAVAKNGSCIILYNFDFYYLTILFIFLVEIVVYMLTFGMGVGTVPWLLLGELCPIEVFLTDMHIHNT